MEGGPPRFPQGFSCPVVLRKSDPRPLRFRLPGSHRLWRGVPAASTSGRFGNWVASPRTPVGSYNTLHATAWAYHTCKVWALPRSLATTEGISFDFVSSGYLDVSVPPVTATRLLWPEGLQRAVTGHYPRRVSPFGHPRINACSRLPVAYRSLPRPSSAHGAKASTVCPS